MLRSAVWFATMACPFSCKYCWQVQAERHGDFKPEPFKKPQEWIDAWTRLRPGILDVTGGEPFMVPGILDIMTAIAAAGSKLAITTNLGYPLMDFVRRLSPAQVVSMTCSYHPTDNGTHAAPMNLDIFLGRLLFLREFGFHLTINIVAWPEQLWLIPKWVELFHNVHKFRVHIDPYAPMAYYPWEYTAAEKDMLRRYVQDDRPLDRVDLGRVSCSGGIDHISVQPDGSAWRCVLERQQHINGLGNILHSDFSLLDKAGTCDQQINCPGCDRDKVTVSRHQEFVPVGSQLPILGPASLVDPYIADMS